jgi:hypothetical protein
MCESQISVDVEAPISPVYRRLKSVVEAKSRAKADEVTA